MAQLPPEDKKSKKAPEKQTTSKGVAGRRRQATSYDVARLAGVSQSAVSRAFSTDRSISDDTRQKVEIAAKSLGYRPNLIARGLITSRSNMIGLILPAASNHYYPEATTELVSEVSKRGSRLLLLTVESQSEVGPALEQLNSYQIDGLIANAMMDKGQLREFEDRNIPVIFYNRPPPSRNGSAVIVDHAESLGRLVDRLWAAGNRSFGLITGPEDSAVANERRRGAIEQLSRLGCTDIFVAAGDYRYESGVSAFTELWAGPHPDAVLCANDAMALGAMDSARIKHHLKIPTDVSIVGFDGFGAGRWLSYQLTTLRQPIHAMAAAAVEMLFQRIENPDLGPERRLFSAEIVCGHSARLGRSEEA